MMDLDRKTGPWSLRVWGLILNLGANALALYGAAGVIRDGSRLLWLVAGVMITLICILVLALPSRDPQYTEPGDPDAEFPPPRPELREN